MGQLSSGVTAPDFELKSMSGEAMRLSKALTARRIALVFYKASCPTSQLTLPYIQRIYEEDGNGDRTIWGISQDEPDETGKFAAENGLQFDVLLDEHPYAVSSAYGLEFVPGIFIVERDGRISFSDFGFSKAALNAIAGYPFMTADDGLPARRPG